jgi:hypothetical protein
MTPMLDAKQARAHPHVAVLGAVGVAEGVFLACGASSGSVSEGSGGSQTQETFRGDARNAHVNPVFAIVRATGPGTITVAPSR